MIATTRSASLGEPEKHSPPEQRGLLDPTARRITLPELAGFYRAMAAKIERRMAVVLCADVVGYSRLMGSDEEGTLAALNSVRREILDPKIAHYRGRTVRSMGDGLLVEFNSVIDAVQCAIAIQDAMALRSAESVPKQRIQFRIGLNIGDVVSDGEAIYGDGIMVASRVESLAEPGGINVSRAVRDQIRDQLPVRFADLGEHAVANLARPVRAFRIVLDAGPAPQPRIEAKKAAPGSERPSVAVLPFRGGPVGVGPTVRHLQTAVAR